MILRDSSTWSPAGSTKRVNDIEGLIHLEPGRKHKEGE